MTWTYRPELDGLRTIAVYLVVLFHSGVILADGGFIGVDLFFVLSGFLVSSILLDEQDRRGRIDLWRFYGRRVRRLLPAAVVVVVSTSAVFVLIAPSVRRLPLIGDAQSALLYVSNWRFLAQQNDYFGADINRSPFLHFWSLSIEEQFYVALPLALVLLLVMARRYRRALPAGIALLTFASLAAQVWWAHKDATHAYYGTEARIYQLLLGVLAALLVRRLGASTSRPRTYDALAALGVAAVLVLGSRAVDLSPSDRGILAAIASCAVLIGLWLQPTGWIATVLARPTMNYLGRISYGTYLWHWPVILVLLEFIDARPLVIAILTVGVASGLASLSFHVLEHPIRTARRLAAHPRATVSVGLASSVGIALLVVPVVLGNQARPVLRVPEAGSTLGGKDRAVPDGIDWFAYADDKGPDDTLCSRADRASCVVHTGTSDLHVALVGDSHGRMLAKAFEDLAEKHDFTLSLDVLEACPWQEDVLGRPDSGPLVTACENNRSELFSGLIREMDVDVVVLTQLPRDRGKYLDDAGLTAREFDAYNFASMEQTLEDITEQGAAAVMVQPMLQVPKTLPNPLECLSGARRTGECRVPVPLDATPSDAFMKSLALTVPGASSVTINDLMCPDAPVCEPLDGDTPVWRDRRHFAPDAIRLHEDEIWTRILDARDSPV